MKDRILLRNNVKGSGRGTQPLMLAHGFGCDQNMWRYVAPAFEEQYRVILFDYVGAGQSDLTAYDQKKYSSLEGYSQDILDICEALDLTNLIFVGHSVSSMIGLLAANRAPGRFAELIMVGPSPRYLNDDGYHGGFEKSDLEGLLTMMEKNYIGWASYLAPIVMGNPDQPELATMLEESFCSTDPILAKHFARATFFADNRADLEGATVPSLIMQCADDMIAPKEVGDYVSRHLPKSTLIQMKATGHCPQVSHPEETIEVIRAYLTAG